MPGQPQIEFVRATANTSFAYDTAPASIPACSITVNKDLLFRRVYADVRQAAGYKRVVTFKVEFFLAGLSVGSITQRATDNNVGAGTGGVYWALGATLGYSGGVERSHSVPHSMLTLVGNSTSGDYAREVCPIEFAAAFDTITLTVSEWDEGSGGDSSPGMITLACLSTFHRF